ncbi:hypothetical protein [Bradyrhizobium sp. RDM4]|uniref:hypothetical protein n=1 Tax=Bradyrhizobium sp. RDM4 TaxID=3378765 RepID=UPI0038FD1661
MTATRWPSTMPSSMPWVMKTILLPVARQIRSSSPCSIARLGVERGERLVHQQPSGS